MKQLFRFLISLSLLFALSCSADSGTIPVVIPTDTEMTMVPSPTPDISLPQPGWFKNPNANILMLTTFGMAIFVDPISMEDFWLAFPGARWIDNNHVGFSPYTEPGCPSKTAYEHVFDLSEWDIEDISLESDKIRKFCISDLGILIIKIDFETNGLVMYDAQAEKWLPFANARNNLINLDALVVENYIFVVQGDRRFNDGSLITLYDIDGRRVINTYFGNVTNNIVKYSQTLRKIAYVSNDKLCFIDIQTLRRECEIVLLDVYMDIELGDFLSSGKLPFSYDSNHHVNYNIRKICIIEISSERFDCPTENLDVFKSRIEYMPDLFDPMITREVIKTWSIIDYRVSPDESLIALCYGLDFPDSYIGLMVVDINGKSVRGINNEFMKGFPPFCDQYRNTYSEYSWRPLP